MPSPIAHLSLGYAVYRYYKDRLPKPRVWIWKLPLQMIVVAGLSLLPDLDVLPAILFRDMHRFHNNFSHSLLLAIPVSLLVAGIFQRVYRSGFWLWFVICLLSYDLHIFTDALTAERGVIMLWPLTEARFASPVKIFYGLQWGLGWFSVWHLWTIFTESIFGLVVIFAMNHFEKQRKHANTLISSEK